MLNVANSHSRIDSKYLVEPEKIADQEEPASKFLISLPVFYV